MCFFFSSILDISAANCHPPLLHFPNTLPCSETIKEDALSLTCPDISLQELNELLFLFFCATQQEQRQIESEIARAISVTPPDTDEEAEQLSQKWMHFLADVISVRLREHPEDTDLVHIEDIRSFFDNEILSALGLDIMSQEAKDLFSEDFATKNHAEAHAQISHYASPGETVRDTMLETVKHVLDLATEQGLSVSEVFATEDVFDQIQGRLITRNEAIRRVDLVLFELSAQTNRQIRDFVETLLSERIERIYGPQNTV